uniref:cytochrome c oxidase subunit 2a n=1 Tax=Gormaniella terricola TaxID=2904618 RepID=UPI0021CCBAA2|nr:cytochrome c oxidase subunit 2a [Gormaniella terricola]UWV18306.1 cytochrome c oxidase subunit 2a [Gormaniella terricola]
MNYFSFLSKADAPQPWQLSFQDPATANMQGMIDLHHDIFFFMITIFTIVVWMGARICYWFHNSKQAGPERINHHTQLELIWSILPSVIVLLIALPSLTLIYSLDDQIDKPGLTVKIVGRQWYWSYEMKELLS